MRGCRGGDSPCAGLGGSPGATEQIKKKKRKSVSFRADAPHPQWKRQVRHSHIAAASSDRPCGMPGERTSSDLAALGHLPQRGRLGRMVSRNGNGRFGTAASQQPPPTGLAECQGNEPHPTSLRSATFPKGEGWGGVAAPVGNGRFGQSKRNAKTRPDSIMHRPGGLLVQLGSSSSGSSLCPSSGPSSYSPRPITFL